MKPLLLLLLAPIALVVSQDFEPILINCGGDEYTEQSGARTWGADYGYEGGAVYSVSNPISGTQDDLLYQSERFGDDVIYELPVPLGNYEVKIHLAELFWKSGGKRVFELLVEGIVIGDIDIVATVGYYAAYTVQRPVIVSDGSLTIEMRERVPKVDFAKMAAIEVNLLGPHLAHAVANGPYYAADIDNSGFATVSVDGTPSHTHGAGLSLASWTWMEAATVKGTGQTTSFSMEVGVHDLALTVVDDDNNESTNPTTVTVFEFGYPVVTALSETTGKTTGGGPLTISGIGFTYSAAQTTVHFGVNSLSGGDIQIVNENTINILVPSAFVAVPVSVSVETPLGESIKEIYTYEEALPIAFNSKLLVKIGEPTVARFSNDGALLVGTVDGKLAKYTLNDDHTQVIDSVVANVAPGRAILGIAFDPLDTEGNPKPYISTSKFFHGEPKSSSGEAINGDIRRISGPDLDVQETIISGLPVSDHDHGINAIEFGDNGELYIQIGGNTNGGIPGELTSDQIQKEGYFSAATLVANLADPLFNGEITYDADDDGAVIGSHGIEVFAAGNRNPYGIVMHSNGNLYGTDNGPNTGYGDMQTGCSGQSIPDVYESDKINRLVKGKYYGHPNSRRASDDNDTRQCVWRSATSPGDADYEAPMMTISSSQGGIMEWQTNHFFGQLRGNLITSKYTQGLYRVILNSAGTAVIPESIPAIDLKIGTGGVDVTQSPSGTLIEAQLVNNQLYTHKPDEPATTELYVNGVFPRRGFEGGGNTLSIYGKNFDNGTPAVSVGGSACPTLSVTATVIKCTIPSGLGTVDVVVSAGSETSSFDSGYRYITGGSVNAAPATQRPTSAPITPTAAPITPTSAPVTADPASSPGPTAVFPVDGQWITVNPAAPLDARHEACFVMVGRKAYLMGGRGANNPVDIYDPETRLWSTGAKAPIELHHMQCVALDDKVYIVAAWTGGYPNEKNVDNVYVYHTASDTWEAKTALPLARRRGSAAVVVHGRRIYVSHGTIGGHEQSGQDLATCVGWIDYYDVDTDTWNTNSLPDAPHPRGHTGGALVDGKICVSGGRDGGTPGWPNVVETDCFDLSSETWSTEASIPQARSGSSYGTTCDGQLMIAGGEGDGHAWSNVEVFDGSTWTSLPGLVEGRHGSGLAVDCHCRQIHIASGSGSQGCCPELYSVETYFFGGEDVQCSHQGNTGAPAPFVAITSAPAAAPVTNAPVATNAGGPVVVLSSDFSASADGFSYEDDLFRGTSEPAYASGSYLPTGGLAGDGALQVAVGGVDGADINGMSGGWQKSFTLSQTSVVSIQLAFQLEYSSDYEDDEPSETLCSIDGSLVGASGNDYVVRLVGDGDGGSNDNQIVGYQTVTLQAGQLGAGSHTLAVGAYNEQKTYDNEETWLRIDSVEVLAT